MQLLQPIATLVNVPGGIFVEWRSLPGEHLRVHLHTGDLAVMVGNSSLFTPDTGRKRYGAETVVQL